MNAGLLNIIQKQNEEIEDLKLKLEFKEELVKLARLERDEAMKRSKSSNGFAERFEDFYKEFGKEFFEKEKK